MTRCDDCGAPCSEACREFSWYSDPETGYRESRTTCPACDEDKIFGREESYCLICDARIRGEDALVCEACVEAAEEQHERGREETPERKRPVIAAREDVEVAA